ncbi:glycoside hydrolase family 43 [Fusarium beomiforme]|uniref:Glycoside hydrolase family 43 n=1 Tax=Fusarium beomiforme TaxID=44412 RepID=A0A9P5DYE0_9HYPO|nr:glycoside hydrolase family 43 [Fusarium beomiforme]
MPSLKRLCKVFALAVPFVQGQKDNLGLGNGYIDIKTDNFKARLVRDAQVLVSLTSADDTFDFLPFDRIDVRAQNGQYHWGDITYRYRKQGSSEWTSGDSARKRRPVGKINAGGALAASNLGPTLHSSSLNITREWIDVAGDLGLRFTLTNKEDYSIELGGLGFPAEFNSIFTNRTAEEMQAHCSLSDPYIGQDAGQIRVAPVKGTGSGLVVTPLNGTNTPLEAYRNLEEPWFESTDYGSQTFEGFYEWQIFTKAWAEKEWKRQEPWNEPTSKMLEPGESLKFGVRFSLSESIRDFDKAVRKTGNPVALGVPGYIVPRDLPAQLYLQSDSGVSSIAVSPQGAFEISKDGDKQYTLTASSSAWGRVRVTITYEDGKVQTVHYYMTKATTETLGDLGKFLTTKAWFNESSDPFKRSPSVMTYDYEKGAIVKQDPRVWIAGLSDEGGTGAYVAAMLKQVIQPNTEEVAKLDEFVQTTIWGRLQRQDYGVRKSLFYYEPSKVDYPYSKHFDWTSWMSWNEESSAAVDRAYDYVHVAVAYWSLYRVARAYPELTSKPWSWYLNQAQKTIIRMTQKDVSYRDLGLMGETVFGEVLMDLKREGNDTAADAVESAMKKRAELWNSQEIPYGSEMAWDSTGQEGVYYWTRHFGFDDSVQKTINSVLGYMPNVPHWGWNGNARRYWDFIYGGKLQRIERQIHHYGSGLNSQVLLSAFRDNPADSYLLRVGYAGSFAPLTNINQDGFPSAAFHSWPDTLKWDGITGDYGGGFTGTVLNSGTYVADDKDLGIVAFGGILSKDGNQYTVLPKDAVRKRVFIGPLKLMITVDVGSITKLTFNTAQKTVQVNLSQSGDSPKAAKATVWVESTGAGMWNIDVKGGKKGRGGWILSLPSSGSVMLSLSQL